MNNTGGLFNLGYGLLIFVPDNIKKLLAIDLIGSYDGYYYVNGWSIIHFISGLIFGLIFIHLDIDSNENHLYFHSAWELFQIIIGDTDLTKFSKIIDVILDTIFYMIGVYFIRKI